MNYYKILGGLEDKLTETLNDEGLVFSLDTSKYPITLTVSHNASPAAQMEFFSSEGSVSSTDAVLKFIFKMDGLEIRVDNRFIITDAFMNKIKGQAKKIHHAFLEGYFAERSAYEAKNKTAVNSTNQEKDLYDAPTAENADGFAGFFDDEPQATVTVEETTAPEDAEGNE